MPTASTAAPRKTEQIHDDKVGEGEWQAVGRICTFVAKLISTLLSLCDIPISDISNSQMCVQMCLPISSLLGGNQLSSS